MYLFTYDILKVPRWIRGIETAQLLAPREVEMYVMGLMQSISTNGPLELEAIVVKSFDELYERKDEACIFLNQLYILANILYAPAKQ